MVLLEPYYLPEYKKPTSVHVKDRGLWDLLILSYTIELSLSIYPDPTTDPTTPTITLSGHYQFNHQMSKG